MTEGKPAISRCLPSVSLACCLSALPNLESRRRRRNTDSRIGIPEYLQMSERSVEKNSHNSCQEMSGHRGPRVSLGCLWLMTAPLNVSDWVAIEILPELACPETTRLANRGAVASDRSATQGLRPLSGSTAGHTIPFRARLRGCLSFAVRRCACLDRVGCSVFL